MRPLDGRVIWKWLTNNLAISNIYRIVLTRKMFAQTSTTGIVIRKTEFSSMAKKLYNIVLPITNVHINKCETRQNVPGKQNFGFM